MEKEILSRSMSDMEVKYILDAETGTVGLSVAPDNKYGGKNRRVRTRSLAELKIIGDRYGGGYLGGSSMKYSDTTAALRLIGQEPCLIDGTEAVLTRLSDRRGVEVSHTLICGNGYFTVKTGVRNNTGNDITLEMLSSFALFNISPYSDGAGENTMMLHRVRGKWSQEGRLVTESLEDLQLEESWTYGCPNSVRFGQIGSMPAKGYFPFMALEDTRNNVIWGVQMGCPSSWQMEITRADDGICLSGGLADREFGHWTRTLRDGESFDAPPAYISVCRGGVDDICARLVRAQEDALSVPECEENLPVIFNEYCTTWGNPSYDNICGILDAVKDRGIDYFVIDCGWFKKDGVRWDISMGDYEASETLFPQGIAKASQKIQEYGMRAGIWFEPETAGEASRAYHGYTEHMLRRDGIILTTQNRRFWDMNDEWVKEYLKERVIEFLKENKFGYIKIDYNETIGIGCDGSDGLGEGLRRNMQGTVEFFRRIRGEIPDIVIENCSSGGNRLEPCFMSLSSMASFSDAHECIEIPIIAANLHRVILPRQSQIWCVIRKNDSIRRIAYLLAAAFLGRMCLSGDVTELSAQQWSAIDGGIAFYKRAVPVIKRGQSARLGTKIRSERHPEGWQAVLRKNGESALCVVHTFSHGADRIEIPLGGEYTIEGVYNLTGADIRVCGEILEIGGAGDFGGFGVLLAGRERTI